MKKTEYFISGTYYSNDGAKALNEVVQSRNQFLEKESEKILEIESENVRIYPIENGAKIYLLLSLSFFTK